MGLYGKYANFDNESYETVLGLDCTGIYLITFYLLI